MIKSQVSSAIKSSMKLTLIISVAVRMGAHLTHQPPKD